MQIKDQREGSQGLFLLGRQKRHWEMDVPRGEGRVKLGGLQREKIHRKDDFYNTFTYPFTHKKMYRAYTCFGLKVWNHVLCGWQMF